MFVERVDGFRGHDEIRNHAEILEACKVIPSPFLPLPAVPYSLTMIEN